MSSRAAAPGFSLVSAIFLIVVVSFLGASMLQLVGEERRSSSLAVLETRAYLAAQAGLEWATGVIGANPASCVSGSFTLTDGGLAGFQVSVTCSVTGHWDGGTPAPGDGTERHVFVLRSTGTRGSFPQPDYVSRVAEATVVFDAP